VQAYTQINYSLLKENKNQSCGDERWERGSALAHREVLRKLGWVLDVRVKH
jgi:hypothetical protein